MIRELMNLVIDRSGEGDQHKMHRLLAVGAIALYLAGSVGDARRVRDYVVRAALTLNDAIAAARVLVGPVGTGHSYRCDVGLTALIDRCLAEMPAGEESLIARLLAEKVCREVMEDGLTDSVRAAMDRLQQAANADVEPGVRLAIARATLHVRVVSPGSQLSSPDFSVARDLTADSPTDFDALTDVLTIEARSSLARGDAGAWQEQVIEFETYCARVARPSELWTRELLWATDLQRRGKFAEADAKAEAAYSLASTYSCADGDIALRLHRLSTAWQQGELPAPFDDRDDGLGFVIRALGQSFGDEPDLAFVRSVVDFLCGRVLDCRPSLATLPQLAVVAQLQWNLGIDARAQELLQRLNAYDAEIVVVGLIPVTCFGPTDRYRAQLCGLLGRLGDAAASAERAMSTVRRARCAGWEAPVLDDLAKLAESAGQSNQAEELRLNAQMRRASLRR